MMLDNDAEIEPCNPQSQSSAWRTTMPTKAKQNTTASKDTTAAKKAGTAKTAPAKKASTAAAKSAPATKANAAKTALAKTVSPSARKSTPAKTASAEKGSSGKKVNPALMRPLQPSKELAAVVGSSPLPRPEVVSKVWDYIKKNNLQDPQNKREIMADEKLQAVFGKNRVTMFEMNKHLAQHLT